MKYLSNFYRLYELLELNAALQPTRVIHENDVDNPKETSGLFIERPERLFITASPDGPLLGWRSKLYLITPKTRLDIKSGPDGRTLDIIFQTGERICIPAPESDFVDPNFGPEERDMTDFFVWLERRLQMPHVRASYTKAT
jgi:hypothetical protein